MKINDSKGKMTIQEMRKKEENYFKNHSHFSAIPTSLFGIQNLSKKLTILLVRRHSVNMNFLFSYSILFSFLSPFSWFYLLFKFFFCFRYFFLEPFLFQSTKFIFLNKFYFLIVLLIRISFQEVDLWYTWPKGKKIENWVLV